jgi:AraC family transcriptional regulator of adaptative response/methylated-DNA-[protein]-cysteine methyltransferase
VRATSILEGICDFLGGGTAVSYHGGTIDGDSIQEGEKHVCDCTTTLDTPLGPLVAGASDEGICLLEFAGPRYDAAALSRQFRAPVIPGNHPHLDRLRDELTDYFAGQLSEFGVPIVVRGTPFQESVWNELLRIPFGETRSYAEIARKIGAAKACRAVGHANGQNRVAILIPCHRVIASGGTLGGYGGGLDRKQFLLDLERRV